jgi:hypothetical protein
MEEYLWLGSMPKDQDANLVAQTNPAFKDNFESCG